MSSRERLDMEPGASTSLFKQKKGCFVTRNVGIVLVATFIGSLLLVGLLVGYLAPRGGVPNADGGAASVQPDGSLPAQLVVPTQRLPRSVVPEHYWVQLQPFIVEGNFTTNVEMTVLVNCLADTDNITLNALNLTLDMSSVVLNTTSNGTVPKVTSMIEDTKNQFFVFMLDSPLKAGNQYSLSMKVVSILNDLLAGFYRSNFTEGNGTEWLAVTQFEATDARRAFPCFDEPAMKATFDITIIHPSNLSALANGPSIKSEPWGDDWIKETFGRTPKMSTYLVAFLVSDFSHLDSPDGKFRVWARKNAVETATFSLGFGQQIISYYDEFFGIPYPMNKTDLAAVPDFNAGAMENWGLITFRETALLYDPLLSSASNLQNVAQVVAHELAHQWFGNLVTMKWWDDLWLNEGFATYMEYIGTNHIQPDWNMLQLFITEELHPTLALDSLKSSHPISVPVHSPEEINEIFDSISYGKGGSIIRMMQYFLGNETFLLGLKNYLKAFAYGNANSNDLWTQLAMTQAMNSSDPAYIDVVTVMNQWATQTGYPVVMVTINGSTVNASQTRFFLDSTNVTVEESKTMWNIPLTWATQDDLADQWSTDTKQWLTGKQMVLNISTDLTEKWIVLNVKEIGYYRVNYDEQNWMKILKQLQSDRTKIPVENRAQIIDDAFSLAQGYELPYEVALNTTLYLSQERDYLPWVAALENIGHLNQMLCRSDSFGSLGTYMSRLIKPLYDVYGWTNTSDQSVLIQYTQISAISTACKYGNTDCISNATDLFNRWKENPTDRTIIHPNLRSIVYCNGIRTGTTADWELVWAAYRSEQVPSEKSKLLGSLACTSKLWLLSRFLKFSLDSSYGVPTQDGLTVINNVISSDYGRELAFNFVREYWSQLFNIYGMSTFSFPNMVNNIGGRLNTPFEVTEFISFMDQVTRNNTLGSAKRAFTQALESAQANVRFMQTHYNNITQWLGMALSSY